MDFLLVVYFGHSRKFSSSVSIILYEKGYGLNLTKVGNLNEANPKLVMIEIDLYCLFYSQKLFNPIDFHNSNNRHVGRILFFKNYNTHH